jgi:hypothetical protein
MLCYLFIPNLAKKPKHSMHHNIKVPIKADQYVVITKLATWEIQMQQHKEPIFYTVPKLQVDQPWEN